MAARLLPIVVVLAVTLALFPSLVQLEVLWTELGDAGYGHGPLLVLVMLWLLWNVDLDAATPKRGRTLATVALLGVSVAWAAALASSTSSIGQALWPLACWLSLAAIYGWPAAREFALPLGLMYFALPIWGPLTNLVLWPLTIKVSSLIVQLIGLNAYVDRNFITIPSGSFEIITGCSGQHFFLVACVIGLLIARLNALTGRQFWVVVLTAAAFAVVTNWIRVVTIIVVGYATDMQHPIVAEGHLTFGWILFACVILVYCLWARVYLRRLPELPAGRGVAPGHSPDIRGRDFAARALLAFVAACVGPVWLMLSQVSVEKAASQPVEFRLPVVSGEWVGPLLSDSPLRPQFVGAVAERYGAYVRADRGEDRVHVFANLYLEHRQGAELVGYSNVVLTESLWDLSSLQRHAANAATGGLIPSFHEYSVRDSSGARWVVRQTNVVGGRTIASDWESKVALGFGALAMQAPRAGFLALAARCAESCEAASASVASVWQSLEGGLLGGYQKSRGNG
jgi:EpsI family protein